MTWLNKPIGRIAIDQPVLDASVRPQPRKSTLKVWRADQSAFIAEQGLPAVRTIPKKGDWSLVYGLEKRGALYRPYWRLDDSERAIAKRYGRSVKPRYWANHARLLTENWAHTGADFCVDTINRLRRSTSESAGYQASRVPVIYFAGVAGSDIGGALARAFYGEMVAEGVPILTDATKRADFSIKAQMNLSNVNARDKRVRIVWKLISDDGRDLGAVNQDHLLPRRNFERDWAMNAVGAAQEAVSGVRALTERYKSAS